MTNESTLLRHIGCDQCGSSDGNALYSDGHTWCFVCQTYGKVDEEEEGEHMGDGTDTSHFQKPQSAKQETLLTLQGEIQGLSTRKIREDTCDLFGYRVGDYNGKPAQFAYYYDKLTRKPKACKVRFANKDFIFIGDTKDCGLYGMHLWKEGGKKVVCVEGEIDALTVSQLQGNKWPVVSVPNGAAGAAKAFRKNLDWLSSFEEVVIMFDMDEPGRTAAKECAELLPVGKAKIADLPLKDANECLQAGKGDAVIQAMWNAKTYRPDGIVNGSDLWQSIISEETIVSVDYPWAGLNELTHGLRTAELVTITAGSGIGKSAVVREIAYHLLNLGETVGMLMLEESTKRTALGIMGLAMNTPLHLSKDGVEEDDLRKAFNDTLGSGRLFLYDHFGSTEIDNLLSRVRYMAKSLECKWVILDHLSIVVSGLDGGDERKLIDVAMTMLRTLVQETGIGLILVSHLKRPDGKGHEEGATTSLSQLRGSHAIAQLSDMVIGLERDQQGDDPNRMNIRILKNRFSGETGLAGALYYDNETGRLSECPPVPKVDGEAEF